MVTRGDLLRRGGLTGRATVVALGGSLFSHRIRFTMDAWVKPEHDSLRGDVPGTNLTRSFG